MYLNSTKVKVERFLKRNGAVLQSQVQFLGSKKMQVKFVTLKEILRDLQKENKATVATQVMGKRKFVVVVWRHQ